MELTLSEVIENLRTLNWDSMINYLNQEFLPNKVNLLLSNSEKKEEKLQLLSTCLELIQTAISNQDVILLCDLLEYELDVIIND